MRKIRDGLHGNFISLSRAVEAIGARIEISDVEVDSRRGLRSKGDRSEAQKAIEKEILAAFISAAEAMGARVVTPPAPSGDPQALAGQGAPNEYKELALRSHIRKCIRESRAAGLLLQALNPPPASSPQWYDAPRGYPIADNSVSRAGLDELLAVSRTELSLSAERSSRMSEIGFDVDDLIHFLDAQGIAHNRGMPLNSPISAGIHGTVVPAQTSERATISTPPALTEKRRHGNQTSRPGQSAVLEVPIQRALAELQAAGLPLTPAQVRAKLLTYGRSGEYPDILRVVQELRITPKTKRSKMLDVLECQRAGGWEKYTDSALRQPLNTNSKNRRKAGAKPGATKAIASKKQENTASAPQRRDTRANK